ncbi:MAG: hypothetical protein HZB15_13620 [Actinobacteria bacterium]|nr:hypothetical protein [Actinomycetota bacterium]
MQLRTDRTYEFAFDQTSFWDRIARVDDYREWWPWLREFDASGLVERARWTCTVHPPVPYSVSFTVDLDDVVEPDRIHARIGGDIAGWARLTVAPSAAGCSIHLVSELSPRARPLRAMSFALRPMVSFGHHFILAAGVRQFTRRSHD